MTFENLIDPLASPDAGTRQTALLRQLGKTLPERIGYRLLHGAERWFHLGDALVREGRPEAALAAFDEAAILAPEQRDILRAQVAVLAGLKRYRAALACVERFPATTDTLAMQASLHIELGDADTALACCDRALDIDATHFASRLTRGAILRAMRRMDEVLENDNQLVAQHPTQAVAHYNLGDAYLSNGAYENALAALNRSLKLAPDNPQALIARALSWVMLRRFDDGDRAFAVVSARFPEAVATYLMNAARAAGRSSDLPMPGSARLIYLSMALHSQTQCTWDERAEVGNMLPEWLADERLNDAGWDTGIAYNTLLLDLAPSMQAQVAARVAAAVQRRAEPWDTAWFERYRRPASQRRQRLRIGFLSPDFRPHPVCDSHWRQLALHDRSRFEVFAYSLRDEGPSPARQRIIDNSDQFAELGTLPPEMQAKRIAADGIDILVDLSGYTDHTRPEILAARPAPIQVQHMGTPGTCGGDFIDYRITDLIVNPPDTCAHWKEKFAWLPDTFWLADDTLTIAETPSRQACGLPDDGFVFCCFNTHQKLEPVSFGVWMRLLRQVHGSVLWLTSGSATSRANLRKEAMHAGVEVERLIFAERVPMDLHLARHCCADLFLDTFIYNAHVTALNAWYAGLPVLTLLGRHMAGRMGASAALAMDFPELVTKDQAQYEATALDLAMNPTGLGQLRQRLDQMRVHSPLFNTKQQVQDIELAFEQMWSRHAAAMPPASFHVKREHP